MTEKQKSVMLESTQKKIEDNFTKNIESLQLKLKDSDILDRSCDVWEGFGKPSVYFHQEAIKEATEGVFLGTEHLKMIYAVLVAWGMHRMGDTDTKLVSFDTFCDNFKGEIVKELHGYKGVTLKEAKTKDIERMVELITTLVISESGSRIVCGSKTLHHILPDLVPPIDRAYSIKFMKSSPKFNKKGSPTMNNAEEWYAKTFLERMQSFLKEGDCQSLTIIKDFLKRKHSSDKSVFLTSVPKVLDNLIVQFVKDNYIEEPEKNKMNTMKEEIKGDAK